MTIKDLAAITGYAVGTVSRALNDHPNVSDKARKVILQAAKESGFQLNVNAKQLKQTSSNNSLVIVKGTGNEFFAEMLVCILRAQLRYVPFWRECPASTVPHPGRACNRSRAP